MAFTSPKIREKLASLYNQLVGGSQWHKNMHAMEVEKFLNENLFSNSRYKGTKRLNMHEYQVFSQFGEDGIINEIFKRIGTTNKYFIEFGVENGLECNTTNLLLHQWNGLWIDGSEKFVKSIGTTFSQQMSNKQLAVLNRFITAGNIESIFDEVSIPKEPDLMVMDIDFNDYYIWEAIHNYKPRVVVLEYNAVFRPDIAWTVAYNANATAGASSYFGASLHAFELLGRKKGYCLVGCTFSGVNAFFVREDCIGDLFEGPYTAANHYEPPRYFLYCKNGHPRSWGEHQLL
ncbi:MAG: hypothetical protein H7Y42_03980 [Chitinophagaceae bacterium]|nr:hypothetical protein [Chitinophagaceae bacterium]